MKTKYSEYALSGSVETLGANLWNQKVGAAIRGKRVDDELQVAARVVFKEIMPELQNFMEQKIAHELKVANLKARDYENTLKSVRSILGTGACSANKCEGCEVEVAEAIRVVNDALPDSKGKAVCGEWVAGVGECIAPKPCRVHGSQDQTLTSSRAGASVTCPGCGETYEQTVLHSCRRPNDKRKEHHHPCSDCRKVLIGCQGLECEGVPTEMYCESCLR